MDSNESNKLKNQETTVLKIKFPTSQERAKQLNSQKNSEKVRIENFTLGVVRSQRPKNLQQGN